ncbi:uncharacterized protein PpBr36_11090 [Pyricularia pennisetigena]|uniref:uncharacterized protein n=1 Tax=Pyricularia pennisetigena TaxID=1578925 RepID=UPI00114E88FF|nr:uncharacterized protein PpBr36_11090 [Pyricularia pennisetigena]TLS20628.1 hypothetical protein PpBr36_11090 [Pyricularia pennisetigena]
MAFAIYLIRIFPQKAYKGLNIGILVFLLVQGIVETVVAQLMCIPRVKIFLPESPGHCLDTSKFYYASALDDLVGAMLWSEVEVSALIICVCVPEIHLLVQRNWPLKLLRIAPPRSLRGCDVGEDEVCSGNPAGQLRGILGRVNIKGLRGSSYESRSGAPSGVSRRARYGVVSFVSAGWRSKHQRNINDMTRRSGQSLVDDDQEPEPASPEHGGVLVTHDIEISIETDDDPMSEMDLAEAERALREDQSETVDSSDLHRDSLCTEKTDNAGASGGEQVALVTSV